MTTYRSNENWFNLPSGCYCGVAIEALSEETSTIQEKHQLSEETSTNTPTKSTNISTDAPADRLQTDIVRYWFFNREPKQNFIFEPIEHVDTMVINHMTNDNRFGVSRTEARSMIHPQYASRFIRRYILDYDQKTGTWQI